MATTSRLRPELSNSVFFNPADVTKICVIQVDLVVFNGPNLGSIPEVVTVKWRGHHVTFAHVSYWLTLYSKTTYNFGQ